MDQIPLLGTTNSLEGRLNAWLRAALDQSGMNQAELARRVERRVGRRLDRNAVNKMVAGKGRLRRTSYLRLLRPVG